MYADQFMHSCIVDMLAYKQCIHRNFSVDQVVRYRISCEPQGSFFYTVPIFIKCDEWPNGFLDCPD